MGALGLALAALPACGGDDGDSPDAGDEDERERCGSPGFTETGCVCDTGALGKRVCQADGFWQTCRCPPASQQCVEGQDVQCFPCAGEDEGRITKCLQGGTFDCACDTRSDDRRRDSGS
jgi:hypothetical protein